ncbi:uncharacterized protein LOC108050347 [Drosophila rhopaloa]|uniref:Uncharacterized protein LOC108050347 n=1 Tax=Drosophila rhopaloa TaxID=1041015 RepID=A0A6P4FJ54_DRORH|nr:uncharacterized protein LOC108050347 [Drosophila rhopaloa]
MLELVVLFLLSSVSFFVAHLDRPTTFWGHFHATCPILMGVLSAGLIYINVGFPPCDKIKNMYIFSL